MNRTNLVRIGRNLRVAHDVGELTKDGADEAINAVANAAILDAVNWTYKTIVDALREGWNDSSLNANREARAANEEAPISERVEPHITF